MKKKLYFAFCSNGHYILHPAKNWKNVSKNLPVKQQQKLLLNFADKLHFVLFDVIGCNK